MRQAGWYSLKEKNELIFITYSLQNRIKAIFGLILLTSLFVYYHITNPEKVFDIANLVVIFIMLFFFSMSLLLDKYSFHLNKSEFTKTYGIFPFITRKNICFSSIESIEIEDVEKKSFLEYLGKTSNSSYFTISINYKDGKRDYLGIHRNSFIEIAKKIKNFHKAFLNN